jgi:RING finger protein 113A
MTDGGATMHNEVDTEEWRDAIALAEENMKLSNDSKDKKVNTKVYKGENAYINYINMSEDDLRMSKYKGTLGPLRAPNNIRSTCRFDYQLFLCKDYNEKGFCGYGGIYILNIQSFIQDSCKFLHDRYDYKPGWQIDIEYEQERKKKQKQLELGIPGVCKHTKLLINFIFRGPGI